MSLRLGRSFLVSTRESREKKVDSNEAFFLLLKMIKMMSLLIKLKKVFFLSFEIHGNRGPHFMNFHCIDDVKRVIATYIDIYSCEISAHWLN